MIDQHASDDEALAAERVPLVVGVTGHRDLRPQDMDRLRSEVRDFLHELKTRYPDTPLVLLSALAEGADRLAATVALESDVRLVVPLPLAQDLYEHDFSTDQSITEFRELLCRAERKIEMPLKSGVERAEVEHYGPARDAQYALAGAFIVRHCQILLALWDGNTQESVGGTAQIVRFRHEGVPPEYGGPSSLLDGTESGPVHHIVTPRLDRDTIPPDLVPLTRRVLLPRSGVPSDHEAHDVRGNSGGAALSEDHHAGAAFDRVFSRMNAFNRDAMMAATPKRLHQSRIYMLPGVPTADLDSGAQRAVGAYVTADALALYYQRRTRRTLKTLLFLGLVAVTSFSFYAHVGFNPVWLLVYLVTLLAAYGLFAWTAPVAAPFIAADAWPVRPFRRLWAHRGDWQSRYLDYRALAEGMRVQIFWHLAGLPDCAADHYLRKQRTELDWIRHAIRTWTFMDNLGLMNAPKLPVHQASLHLVLKHWVNDQHSFFANAARRDRTSVNGTELLVFSLFILAIGFTIALLIIDYFVSDPEERLHQLLIVAAVLLIAASALVEVWAEKTAVAEQVKQYARMRGLFARASELLRDADAYGGALEGVIRELGEEALTENADWLLLHRSRPVSVARGV